MIKAWTAEESIPFLKCVFQKNRNSVMGLNVTCTRKIWNVTSCVIKDNVSSLVIWICFAVGRYRNSIVGIQCYIFSNSMKPPCFWLLLSSADTNLSLGKMHTFTFYLKFLMLAYMWRVSRIVVRRLISVERNKLLWQNFYYNTLLHY